MRKGTALLVFGVLLVFCAAGLAEVWVCPKCGQTGNTGNYCPNCASARPVTEWTCPKCGHTGNTSKYCPNCASPRPEASGTWTCAKCGQTGNTGVLCINCFSPRTESNVPGIGTNVPGTGTNGVTARLKMQLTVRSGPGSWYEEVGTYFSGNYAATAVRVLTKAWDSKNQAWWIQVEFTDQNMLCRGYTEPSRVEADISRIPQETVLGYAVMVSPGIALQGPGVSYALAKHNVPDRTLVTVTAVENGYAQVEFHDSRLTGLAQRRAWVPRNTVSSWSGDGGTPEDTGEPEEATSFAPNVGRYELLLSGAYATTPGDYVVVYAADLNSVTFSVTWSGIYAMHEITAPFRISSYPFTYSDGEVTISGRLSMDGTTLCLTLENVIGSEAFRQILTEEGYWKTEYSFTGGGYDRIPDPQPVPSVNPATAPYNTTLVLKPGLPKAQVRAEPYPDAPAIGTLKPGDSVTSLGVSSTDARGGIWYRIRWKTGTAWISSEDVALQ